MSVIIAIKDKNRVVVGVDVRMSCSDTYVDSYQRRPKALHINDRKDIIVGGVGNIGLVDLFRQIVSEYREEDLYDFDRSSIMKYIVPSLITGVREYDMRDNDGKLDGELLLAIKDRAYIIAGNYSVSELVKYAAEGSGRDAAYGSLYTSANMPISVEEKIRIAIEAAGSCISSVSKVSYIGDTAGKRFLPQKIKN